MNNLLNVGDKLILQTENPDEVHTYFVYSIEPDIAPVLKEISENKRVLGINKIQQIRLLNREGFGVKVPFTEFKGKTVPINIGEIDSNNQIYNYQVIEDIKKIGVNSLEDFFEKFVTE